MRGLLGAGLLLAPALATGVAAAASQDNTPSAFITLDLPEAGLNNGTPFLSLRLDVLESQNACGIANVTINGQPLPKEGQLALQLVPNFEGVDDMSKKDESSAVVSWETDCVSWGGQDREQIMRLRVVSVNGVDTKADIADENDMTTIRFRQTEPARIILVEGVASVFQFNDNHYAVSVPESELANKKTGNDGVANAGSEDSEDTGDTNDNDGGGEEDIIDVKNLDVDDVESADFIAWENSLILLHHHVALLHHDIRMRERYVFERFGPPPMPHPFGGGSHSHRFGRHDEPCSDVSSFIGSIFHKISGTAKAFYGGLLSGAFIEDGPHSHHGPHRFGAQHGPGHFGGPSHGPHHGPHSPPGPPGDSVPHRFMPHCLPHNDRTGPPPLPLAPPSFLFHCPVAFSSPPAFEDLPPTPPPPGPPPPSHQGPPPPGPPPSHDGPPPPSPPPDHHAPHGPPGAELHHPPHGDGPGDNRHGHPGDDNLWTSKTDEKKPLGEKVGGSHGWKMHGHDSPPPGGWQHGHHDFGGPRPAGLMSPRRAPVVKMVAFSALILVLFLVFVRHCSNRRMHKNRLRGRRVHRPRGFRGFATRCQKFAGDFQERRERREARRARRAQRRASARSFFGRISHFLFGNGDVYEKVADSDAHIEASTATTNPSMEQEIAEFRVAADVVGQMIEAEEGRSTVVGSAESRSQQENQEQQEQTATRVVAPTPISPPLAPIAPYHQPPPPPPPPPSVVTSSSVYSGYGRRDASGIDSDFDDTDSMPPAYSSSDYSSSDYSYVNLVEASVVADGFQYRPGSSV